MYYVVVECPGGMYVVPESGDGACSPRLAGAFMRPLFGFSQVYVLEYRPFFRPVSLEEFVPPYNALGVDSASTPGRIVVGGDCVAMHPCGGGFKDDCHEFKFSL
jgi:hypothetical protein